MNSAPSDEKGDWTWSWHLRTLAFVSAGLLILFAAARLLLRIGT